MSPPNGAKDLPPRCILIVDDDATFRRFLVRAMSALGQKAQDVSSLEEMEAFLNASHIPDLVFLDWNLGHTTAKEMYTTLLDRGIPVIVMTGDPVAIEHQVDRILAKPFDLDTLRSLLAPERGQV